MAAFSEPWHPALDHRALAAAEPLGGRSSPATSLGHSSGPRPTWTASVELAGTRSPPPERQVCHKFFFLPSLASWLHEASQISRCRAKLLPPREAAMGRREFLAMRWGAEVGTLTARPEKRWGRALGREVRGPFSPKCKTSLCCRRSPGRSPLQRLQPPGWVCSPTPRL